MFRSPKKNKKNGFEIYRIDGVYEYNDQLFNFELQIKSLVNVFWGEIEHKIIYKKTIIIPYGIVFLKILWDPLTKIFP